MNLDGNQASIREAVDNGALSGAVTLAWQAGKVLQVNEIGHRDVEAGLPMQRDTIFRVASMTKPVTVAAAMTTGSTDTSGREPWAPRPCRTTRSASAAAKAGPGLSPMTPAGMGATCWPRTTRLP